MNVDRITKFSEGEGGLIVSALLHAAHLAAMEGKTGEEVSVFTRNLLAGGFHKIGYDNEDRCFHFGEAARVLHHCAGVLAMVAIHVSHPDVKDEDTDRILKVLDDTFVGAMHETQAFILNEIETLIEGQGDSN